MICSQKYKWFLLLPCIWRIYVTVVYNNSGENCEYISTNSSSEYFSINSSFNNIYGKKKYVVHTIIYDMFSMFILWSFYQLFLLVLVLWNGLNHWTELDELKSGSIEVEQMTCMEDTRQYLCCNHVSSICSINAISRYLYLFYNYFYTKF